jgi:hypothetical protein
LKGVYGVFPARNSSDYILVSGGRAPCGPLLFVIDSFEQLATEFERWAAGRGLV